MDFSELSLELTINLLLLLFIGMGPKIALVPFLEKTKGMDAAKKREIGTAMVKTATITALVLYLVGALLMKMLHISSGAVSVGGGIVLLMLALKLAAGPNEDVREESNLPIDHKQLAIYPLAIPYLLNPVGIAVLLVASSKVETMSVSLLVVGLILFIGAWDFVIFRNIDILAKRMRPSTLLVSEIVFGILLAALAVEMATSGLDTLGVIHRAEH